MVTLNLNYPIKHGEEEISTLEFRRPTYKDVKNSKISDLDNFSAMMNITARLTGTPESVLLNMDLSDVVSCTKIVSDFLVNSQAI